MTTKKILLCHLLAFLSVTGISCNDIFTFTLDKQTTATINGSVIYAAGITLPDFPSPPVDSNNSTDFENNGTTKSLVKKVILRKLTVIITNPPSRDFDFLEKIDIYIDDEFSDGNASNVLTETLLAYKNPVPLDATELVLDVTNADVVNFLKRDQFKLITKTRTDEILNQDVDLEIQSSFEVSAHPF